MRICIIRSLRGQGSQPLSRALASISQMGVALMNRVIESSARSGASRLKQKPGQVAVRKSLPPRRHGAWVLPPERVGRASCAEVGEMPRRGRRLGAVAAVTGELGERVVSVRPVRRIAVDEFRSWRAVTRPRTREPSARKSRALAYADAAASGG